MNVAAAARRATLALWLALCAGLLSFTAVGYPWVLCGLAVLPLLAPLPGLLRGRRRTYAWATLFTVPYVMFTITELLANPRARWPASVSLLLVFGWFCAMVLYLRSAPRSPE